MARYTRAFQGVIANSTFASLFIFSSVIVVAGWFLLQRWQPDWIFVVGAAVGGFLFWTLTEYVLHRTFSHSGTRHRLWQHVEKRFHGKHHEAPQNLSFIPFPLLFMGVLTGIVFLVSWLAFQALAFPFLIGFLTGYVAFLAIHTGVHLFKSPRLGILRKRWEWHFLHHYLYPDRAFGVTALWWDQLFGTEPPYHAFYQTAPGPVNVYEPVEALDLIAVDDEHTRKAFLQVPRAIYKDDPHWVEPLHKDIEAVFDPVINPYFKHGSAHRWVLVNGHGELIGRIAAFVNHEKAVQGSLYVGGMGFFECIHDGKAASALFDAARQWLEDWGMDAAEAPINFGENEKFWGLLTKGFIMPSYGMNYNPPYYRNLFEQYGFEPTYEQYTNHLSLRKPLPERFERIAQRVLNNPRYSFRHYDATHFEEFVDDFLEIYNLAWVDFDHFKPLDRDYVRQSMQEMKAIMEERLIWFAYVDGNPAGFLVATPDVNPILQKLHGKLDWAAKLKFLYLRQTEGLSKIRVIIMGIVPEHQRCGLESGLILNGYRAGQSLPQYDHVELAWVGNFNAKMIAIHEAMGATFAKQHVTYRKLFH